MNKILNHIKLLEKMQLAGGINNKPTTDLLKVCVKKINSSSEALQKLAKLGNGDNWGNSDGNKIAQRALNILDETINSD